MSASTAPLPEPLVSEAVHPVYEVSRRHDSLRSGFSTCWSWMRVRWLYR